MLSADTETRQGMYKEYTIEKTGQKVIIPLFDTPPNCAHTSAQSHVDKG